MAVADCIRTCRECGCSFSRMAKGEPTKFCGHECRIRYRKKRVNGRKKLRNVSRAQCCIDGCEGQVLARGHCSSHYYRLCKYGDALTSAERKRVQKQCAHCGIIMVLKPAIAAEQRYCSVTCARAYRAMTIVPMGTCKCCGSEFRKCANHRNKSGTKEYCSVACARAHPSRIVAERDALRRIAEAWRWKPKAEVVAEIAALHRISRYVESPRLTRLPCRCCGVLTIGTKRYPRTCLSCWQESLRVRRRAQRKTPNGAARRRAEKAKRRAVERGSKADKIDPIKVFDRDAWRCHLCGCKTPPKLRGTHQPNAPELDHVVPLALGGTHTWGNVRCSCRRCNSKKGASAIGQLGFDIAA